MARKTSSWSYIASNLSCRHNLSYDPELLKTPPPSLIIYHICFNFPFVFRASFCSMKISLHVFRPPFLSRVLLAPRLISSFHGHVPYQINIWYCIRRLFSVTTATVHLPFRVDIGRRIWIEAPPDAVRNIPSVASTLSRRPRSIRSWSIHATFQVQEEWRRWWRLPWEAARRIPWWSRICCERALPSTMSRNPRVCNAFLFHIYDNLNYYHHHHYYSFSSDLTSHTSTREKSVHEARIGWLLPTIRNRRPTFRDTSVLRIIPFLVTIRQLSVHGNLVQVLVANLRHIAP